MNALKKINEAMEFLNDMLRHPNEDSARPERSDFSGRKHYFVRVRDYLRTGLALSSYGFGTIFVRVRHYLRTGHSPSSYGFYSTFIPEDWDRRYRRLTLLYSGFTFMSFLSFVHIFTPYYILWRTHGFVK